MNRRVLFRIGELELAASLLDTAVAAAVWEALPLEAQFSTWGDEIYFDCGLTLAPDSTSETVAMGDLGYWPPGRALCIFFGPTPASGPGEIRPASPVAVFGRVEGDPRVLKGVRSRTVRVERLDGSARPAR